MSIRIIADSTCYLPSEYINKYKISIVSLNVLLNGVSYRETDVSNKWFYEEMAKSSEIPKSSQPSIEDVYSCMEELVKDGHDVVGIFLSSDMSGTFSTSNLVKEMILEAYPNANIVCLDSRSNCMQAGFAVLEAAKAASSGKSLDEVVDIANNVINNSKFIFVPDTLEYLKKGGRIGGAAALFGSLLQIRTKKKSIDKIVLTILEQNIKSPIKGLIVHHINCENEGLELANRLKTELNLPEVKVQSIGPIIGLHVGPGSIGVAYHY